MNLTLTNKSINQFSRFLIRIILVKSTFNKFMTCYKSLMTIKLKKISNLQNNRIWIVIWILIQTTETYNRIEYRMQVARVLQKKIKEIKLYR